MQISPNLFDNSECFRNVKSFPKFHGFFSFCVCLLGPRKVIESRYGHLVCQSQNWKPEIE